MATKIAKVQLRRDTAANWTAANPVLLAGELGLEIDTATSKAGDGTTPWSSLPYEVDTTAIPASHRGAANGVSSLDADGLHKASEYRPATPNAPGAMTALDRSRFVYDETLTSVGAAVAGDVVRRVSAGVWAPAASDSATNCAGPLGVYDGAAVNPLSGNSAKLNFVAAPTLNVPCYLSATAGRATSTVPSPLAISVFLGCPYVDTSVGAVYSAKVGNLITSSAPMSLKDQLTAMACQDLGGTPANYDIFYDPFDAKSFTVGFDANPPIAGWPTSGHYPNYGQISSGLNGPMQDTTSVSAVKMTGADALNYWITSGIKGPSQWAPNDRILWVERIKFSAAGRLVSWVQSSVSIGIWNAGAADPNKFYAFGGGFNPTGGNPVSGDLHELGARDTDYHWFAVEFLGNGTWRASLDFGAWIGPFTDSAGVGGYQLDPMIVISAPVVMTIDDLFWAVKRF